MAKTYYPDYDQGRRAAQLSRLKVVDPSDVVAATKSRVPAFTDQRKTEYLVLRSVSFSHQEALKVLSLDDETYHAWMIEDLDFVSWAVGGGMMILQAHVGEQVLRSKFLRNVFIQLYLDGEVLNKKMMNPETMTSDDKIDAREASRRYSAANIAAMMKVLEPEQAEEHERAQELNITIQVDQQIVEMHQSRELVASQLLDQFTQKRVTIDESGRVVE